MVISGSTPIGGRHGPAAPVRGHDLAGLQHDLARVERLAGGVRRADAGAAAAHRAGVGVEQLLPGEVLDHRRRRRSRARSPSGWASASSRPSGARGRCRYMFSGDVNMCRSIVIGQDRRGTRRTRRRGRSTTTWCQPSSVSSLSPSNRLRQRVADEAPLLERRAGRSTAMRNTSATKPVTADDAGTCRGSRRARAWS